MKANGNRGGRKICLFPTRWCKVGMHKKAGTSETILILPIAHCKHQKIGRMIMSLRSLHPIFGNSFPVFYKIICYIPCKTLQWSTHAYPYVITRFLKITWYFRQVICHPQWNGRAQLVSSRRYVFRNGFFSDIYRFRQRSEVCIISLETIREQSSSEEN